VYSKRPYGVGLLVAGYDVRLFKSKMDLMYLRLHRVETIMSMKHKQLEQGLNQLGLILKII
jgi:hypothetical protein